jgi:hypothetical protein
VTVSPKLSAFLTIICWDFASPERPTCWRQQFHLGAIASIVGAADPQPEEARWLFRSRLINVTVGCAVGLVFLVFGSGNERMIPAALAVTVLISTYLVRAKIMWRQAPITTFIVIASGIAGGSARVESDAACTR